MTGSSDSRYLSDLHADLDRSLSSFLYRTGSLTPKGGRSRDAARAAKRAGPAVDMVAAILDDERGVRALAKEIKRLITEDKRRGMGV